MNGLDQAIASLGGNKAALAEYLGVSRQLVQWWQKQGRVPAKWAIPVEKVTGISRHDLRPDLYPRE